MIYPRKGNKKGGEVSLANCGMCNLTELLVSDIEHEEDFEDRLRAATLIGTLQATYTDFWYLRPEWKRRAEEDALLGVSLTGMAGMPKWIELGSAARKVKDWNEHFSRILGINPAKRLTTVKPSGTTSLVLGTSSGIHPYYAPFYIRRMQLFKNEALYGYVMGKVPELVEDHYLRPSDTGVLSIPIKSPQDAVFRDEGALGTLKRVRDTQLSWIKSGHVKGLNRHNVSCTINVKEDEWDAVKEWMWENREDYAGISILPYDSGTYKQAPFEEIDEATYEALSEHISKINLSEIQETQDKTDLTGEQACAGGACEVTTI